MDDEMMRALQADGEKLRAMTGEDHGPVFLADRSIAAITEARGKLHDLLCLPKHEAGDVARQWAQEAYDLLAEAVI